ncbi:ATP-binding cassette domain-containing protein [Rhizobium leguminosarum]|uniref:ATP-binding cassette domain-containing protein n=1 Tax=Rhizobium leguminosarum TaxID=384 RepID=UPI001C9813F6|nr:ATP-binding cassette domain-containing protein [Rhizobium leguminosarum]MBY5406684.1 sugar ABC transporter ATP-binding protein [Rhizobium leguminosarum]
MEDNSALLSLQGIEKRFGAVTAIEHVDFSVAKGEVVALLGDNGAGKSTLVKIISGGLQPTAGSYRFDGVERQLSSPHDAKKLGIQTVYQDLSICPNVDVVANFFMGREIVRHVFGIPILREREMRTITESVLRQAGTRIPSVKISAEHLSGGQRQAIELNRFVYWGGKLVVLDEPFAALGVEQVRRSLETIADVRRQGIAVIIVTHNMSHAFKIADRLVIMRQGRVVGDFTTSETTPEEVVRTITGTQSGLHF